MQGSKQVNKKIKQKAYDYLARREHSVFELARKLSKFAGNEEVELVLDELIRVDHQSDQRFSEQFVRSRVNRGQGPIKIKYELKQHHIDPQIITHVFAEYEGQWSQRATEVRCKKFGSIKPADFKQQAKQAQFLQQRGFRLSDINLD